MCFRGVLKPQNVLKYAGGHFVFIKYGENAHWSHRSAALYVSQRDRLSSPGLKRLRHLVQPSNNFSISPTYGGREMHSVFALSDFRKRIPKIDSLSKRIPKMDWWPRDAFRIRIPIFENGFAVKTDSQNGFENGFAQYSPNVPSGSSALAKPKDRLVGRGPHSQNWLAKKTIKNGFAVNRIHKMDSPSKRLTKPKTLKTFA